MRTEKEALLGYYTRAEAAARLGISKTELDTYARNGRLKREQPPGKKQHVYDKEQVDELAREREAFQVMDQIKATSRFVQGTPDDMEDCARLMKAIFGSRPNVERRIAWMRKNPEVCYLLKVDEKVVGCAFILPLLPEMIEEILAEEITPPIFPVDVQPYVSNTPTHLYVMSVGIQPGIPLGQKRLWAARLVTKLMDAIIALGKRGIDIQSITARSETPDGIGIMRHMGFTEIPSITNNRNFTIDVERSGIPAILDYKEALARARGRPLPPRRRRDDLPAAIPCPNCGDLDSGETTLKRRGKSMTYRCTRCGYEEDL